MPTVGGLSRSDCLEMIEQALGTRIEGLDTLERRDLKALLHALWKTIPGAAEPTGPKRSIQNR